MAQIFFQSGKVLIFLTRVAGLRSDDARELETALPECPPDTVLLDESSYSTDIHEFVKQLVCHGIDKTEWKFRIIQWVADSPDYATKRVRKKAAIEYLGTPKRTFERWLQIYFSYGADAVPKEPNPGKGRHHLTQKWKILSKRPGGRGIQMDK